MRTREERERRLARARAWSRIEIGLGTIAVVLPALIVVAAPPQSFGIHHREPAWRMPIELVAYVALVVGYLWMLKIRFTGPEDGAPSNWRSH